MTARSTGCTHFPELLLTDDIVRQRGRLPYFPDPPLKA
ncbi:hypothetical protein SAMN05216429_101342 [Marinobacter persicus]|uniref:Uncharacterized protein n=1 Tax=Marinobacter persicus TaxID=930118 RepID=A0A1I3PZH6_9GAMM|nr:hypothetical protein SAMN05216429_101342 [Marinobacter persicus]